MLSALRISLIAVFTILIIVGILFANIPTTALSKNTPANGQSEACSQILSTRLFPLHSLQSSCPINSNEWVTLNLNSSLTSSVDLSFNSSGRLTSLYRGSATSYALTFPASANGSVIATVSNSGSGYLQVSGVMSVYVNTEGLVTTYSYVHQYRTEGYSLVGVSLLALFLLVWNPRQISSDGLDAITNKLKPIKFRKLSFSVSLPKVYGWLQHPFTTAFLIDFVVMCAYSLAFVLAYPNVLAHSYVFNTINPMTIFVLSYLPLTLAVIPSIVRFRLKIENHKIFFLGSVVFVSLTVAAYVIAILLFTRFNGCFGC
ncbi:MAG TPA: hypothetical protein VJN71_00415 [Nitrososphaerales archaeon]|nr:hypothetical protein [Nitrososphaerales archaeon]